MAPPDQPPVPKAGLKAGVPHGPFKRYHESGELALEGQHVEGVLHGLVRWFNTDQPTTQVAPIEGLSKAVWKSEAEYELGRVIVARHFDRAGQRINPDGSPIPARPKGVSEKAEYHSEDETWVEVAIDKQGRRHGRMKTWARAGQRKEEADWDHGARHGTARQFGAEGKVSLEGRFRRGERTGVFRFYADDGTVLAEREFHGDRLNGHSEEYDEAGELDLEETYVRDRRDGVFRLKTAFTNPAVAEIQGTWRKGRPESPWTLMGHDGVPLRMLDMDSEDAGLGSSDVFTDAARPAEAWFAQGDVLVGKGRRNEAVVAYARGAAALPGVERLLKALEPLAIPVAGARAQKIYEQAAAAGSVAGLLTGLRTGASPSRVFQALAVVLDAKSRSRAALDLVNAAVLLEPDRVEICSTRATVLMGLGLVEQAARDANLLAPVDPDRSEFLLDCGRVLFPTFDFWPAAANVKPDDGAAGDKPVRKADEVKRAMATLASRLRRTRTALLERVRPDVPWMVPELKSLLPKGPVELKSFSVAGEGKGQKAVDVNEARGLPVVAEVPALMRAARADWAALTWLCWSVGLDKVALPKKLKARPGFSKAAAMSAQRLWRCRDKRLSGGAKAREQGAPGFEWEGLEIDGLARELLPMPEAEWAEVQAVMQWLSNEDATSPWQDGLRDSLEGQA